MELFQELVFTISFSLIVSLLIVKLISVSSSCDNGNPIVSIMVEEKIEKEWVVCEDPVKVSEEVAFGSVDAELVSEVVIKDTQSVSGVGDCQLFDEIPERIEISDDDPDSAKSDDCNVVESIESLIQEDCVKSVEVQHESSDAINVGEVKLDEEDEIFDDDWQGIETTDLEKSFGAAVAFMGSKNSADRVSLLDNEIKILLYGLHRVAIEGSCFEPQPMAIKVSARANWNSWKRLENLGREDAMEQYIALLSQHVPDWTEQHASDKQ